jgi:energy-coupling factor transport system permease protein
MTATVIDPYAAQAPASPIHFLYGLNPLSKLAGPIPAMVVLIFVRDLATPLAFLALAYAVILIGARLTARLALVLFVVVPVAIAVIGLSFSLWVDAALVDATVPVLQVGEWALYSGALQLGYATALRLAAIAALALVGGVTTSGPDLVRASIQQLRVPYRIGYTAVAAFRFAPRFSHELEVIRAAHRVRGHHGGRGPFSRIVRAGGYVVPLLAGAIRHAERVALAMDARAFGAYPTRTERHLIPFRRRDVVFVVLLWVASAVLLWLWFPWQLG